LWALGFDDLEADENYVYYSAMVARQVPHAAVAAKLERDGEDNETVREL
jgi:hypothetical protein